jgi:hypothetical protein
MFCILLYTQSLIDVLFASDTELFLQLEQLPLPGVAI